jgi:hypothetical protein
VFGLLVPGAPKEGAYPIPRHYLQIAIQLQDREAFRGDKASIYFGGFCDKGEALLQSSNIHLATIFRDISAAAPKKCRRRRNRHTLTQTPARI